MAKRRKINWDDVAFYCVVLMIIGGIILGKIAGLLPEPEAPPTYTELCKQECEAFGMDYHRADEWQETQHNRCWCLDAQKLPKEVPL